MGTIGKYVYKYAIEINGDFMKGMVYTNTREEAYERLPIEMQIGLEKLNKAYPWDKHYIITEKRNLLGIDGLVDTYPACADYYYPWISYKVRKVRVPV